jgi:hypothetical protein
MLISIRHFEKFSVLPEIILQIRTLNVIWVTHRYFFEQIGLSAGPFKLPYHGATAPRKYLGNVRPTASRAAYDPDLDRVARIKEKR